MVSIVKTAMEGHTPKELHSNPSTPFSSTGEALHLQFIYKTVGGKMRKQFPKLNSYLLSTVLRLGDVELSRPHPATNA